MDRFVIRASDSSQSSGEYPSDGCCSSSGSSGLAGRRRLSSESSAASSTRIGELPECKRPKKQSDCRRLWNSSWESEFLVTYDRKCDVFTCLKCMVKIETVKKYNLQRHCAKVHPEVRGWSEEKRKLFVQQAKDKLKKMNETLTTTLQPSALLTEATYKLGHTLVKHHKPVSFAEPMVNWAASCDRESKIFKNMPKSRQTITRRIDDLATFIQNEKFAA